MIWEALPGDGALLLGTECAGGSKSERRDGSIDHRNMFGYLLDSKLGSELFLNEHFINCQRRGRLALLNFTLYFLGFTLVALRYHSIIF